MNSRDLGIEPGQVVLLLLDPQVKCYLIIISNDDEMLTT